MFKRELPIIIRFILVMWAGLACPWYAVIAISYFIGIVASMLSYSIPRHIDPITGAIVVSVFIAVSFYLGRGVYLNDAKAIKSCRILLGVGTVCFILRIGFELYLLVKGSSQPWIILVYIAKILAFITVNGLCWTLLGKKNDE